MPVDANLKYYPSLKNLITLDSIPDSFDFIKTLTDDVFKKIFYKDFQSSVSNDGATAFYSLEIVTREELGFDLLFGLKFILNRDPEQNDISSFPVTVRYNWPIIAHLDDFDIQTFSFSLEDFYQLGLAVFDISELEVLNQALKNLAASLEPSENPYEQFVDDLNAALSGELTAPISYPVTDSPAEEMLRDIEIKFENLPSLAVFKTSILNVDLQITKDNLQGFYKAFIPYDIEAYLKDILLPQAAVTLELSASIEFPRNILRPWEGGAPDLNPSHHVYFDFAKALLYADTKAGLGYQLELAGSLSSVAEIGRSGILIEIDSLKLDLSKTTNIPEADADGRPENFTGVYARAVAVSLPARWFHDDVMQGTQSTGLRLGGYNILIGTGGFSGTLMLETIPLLTTSADPYYFDNEFSFNFPIIVYEKNSSTSVIEEVSIPTLAVLKEKLFPDSSTAIPTYAFKFPLSVTEPPTTGTVLEFADIVTFQNYLNSFPNDITVDSVPTLWKRIGGEDGFRVGFNKFDITFKQNVVTSSNILGKLIFPKLKDTAGNPAEIHIAGGFNQNGDFELTASEPQGIKRNLFNLLFITFQSVGLKTQEDTFYIEADTKIGFVEDSFAYTMFRGQEIDLPALRFYSDGRFEIAGGNSFIPVNLSLDLGPVEMSVSGIHLGTVQREHGGRMRNYNYFGFDGALSIDPIGVDIRGNGVKYYYTIDNDEVAREIGQASTPPVDLNPDDFGHSYFHISTLELDLIIPGTADPKSALAIIKGSLTIPEPGVSTEYSGKISLQLPQASIYGEANMRLDPKYPAYLIDVSVDFPAPIPLGPIGINGFRGLLGQRYVAEKQAIDMTVDDKWYDYYMAPVRGINVDKFSGPDKTADYDRAFSVGVGATFSTMDGSGRTASLRAMLLLSLPSMFAIDAGLTILSERLGMAEDDPTLAPFYAFVIIGDDSLEFGAGANFKLNKSKGWLLTITARLEAGFFFKNQRPWYINFGTPEDPITATLFSDVINAKAMSFLMLSAKGIESGARVDFAFDFVIAKLECSLEVGGYISFERPQVGGYVKVSGSLKIDFWIIEITATISVHMSVEIPKPFLIFAEIQFKACVRIKLLIVKVTICVPLKFTLKWQKNNQMIYDPIPPLTYETTIQGGDPDYKKLPQAANLVKAVNMLTFETFDLIPEFSQPEVNDEFPIIPLDTYIDIKMEKGLDPSMISGKIGGHTGAANNFIELIPPKLQLKGGKTVRQVKHKYSITRLEIKAHDGGGWADYHPFKAIVTNPTAAQETILNNLKIGFWQKNNKQYDTIRILATNPFSFLEGAEPGWFIPEQYGITPSSMFCTDSSIEVYCADVELKAVGTTYHPQMNPSDSYFIDGAYFSLKGLLDIEVGDLEQSNVASQDVMRVLQVPNPHGIARSLVFSNANTLVIKLPESAVNVKLKITTNAQGVTIKYYRTTISTGSIFQTYELIESVYKNAAELVMPVEFVNTPYNHLRNVFKIEITPDFPSMADIQQIEAQMQEMMTNSQESSSGESAMALMGEELALYTELAEKLRYLKDIGCTAEGGGDCKKDERLCQLYAQLMELYSKCFVPLDIRNIFNYCKELDCFREFIKLISEFDSSHQEYDLISVHIRDQFQRYSEMLEKLMQWCSYGNNEQETLEHYNLFVSNAMTIINIIGVLGDCNCEDNAGLLSCTTAFQQVCWTTVNDFEYNQTIPSQAAVVADANAMIAGINLTAQPIWRPNTKYYIRFDLKDEVDDGDHGTQGTFSYYYGFRTVGPIGHFHNYPGAYPIAPTKIVNDIVVPQSVEEFPLTSLTKYIDYERSYPNADGNIILAKPLFYQYDQCKIDIFFSKPWAHHMLKGWGQYGDNFEPIEGAMHIAIKDPVSNVIIPYPLPANWQPNEYVPEYVGNGPAGTSWVDDDDPNIPLNIQILQNYIAQANLVGTMTCQITLGDAIHPAAQSYSITLTNLKPRKLYTAIVYNAFEVVAGQGVENQKVHEYVFQTSRYGSFREQVESYILKEYNELNVVINEKHAVYNKSSAFTEEQIENAKILISGHDNAATLALETKYYHRFDRVIEGIFGFRPFDPPTTTDFITITDEITGSIIALLVRNPEPFNNPKIPFLEIQDSIEVLDGTLVNPDYKVLFSKDYSQALIINENNTFGTDISIRFKYKIWNGSVFILPNVNPLTYEVLDPLQEAGIVTINNLLLTNF